MIAMAQTIKPDLLSREIQKTLKKYADDIKTVSIDAAEAVAKDAVSELKQNSPKRKTRRGGRYARNWDYQTSVEGATIYNKAPTYRLTHLLEKGHAKRNGGRVRAYPHIEPVEEAAIKEYEDKIIKEVQGN